MTLRATKLDEFSEKCQRGGGGSFLIRKFLLQILDLYIGLFWTFCENNLQYNFPKMKGEGTKAIWIFSENSSNWWPDPSLTRAEYGSQRLVQLDNVNFEPIIRGLKVIFFY